MSGLLDTTVLFVGGDATRARQLVRDDAIHYLVVAEGAERGRRIELGPAPLVLGRALPADVVLADSEISRSHCSVNVHLGEVIVADLNSTNGTFIDGARVNGAAALPVGGLVSIGRHVMRHERLGRAEAEAQRELDRDLERARQYVEALLPAPIRSGPIRAHWVLQPCALLGGDAFGYQALDDRRFAVWLMDVSGHGAGAAMLAVSVINVIRQRALPNVDMTNPAAVLAALNQMFPMEAHGNMFFTLWYGVFDATTRTLAYASAGHHPAYLVSPERDRASALRTPGIVIGAMEDPGYAAQTTDVPPGTMLYVFSDGVFEITEPATGRRWELADFLPVLLEPPLADTPDPDRLLARMQLAAGRRIFEDDFTMVTVRFD
jgi:serine phosphatase RsbU (regulator of sigma subunit)